MQFKTLEIRKNLQERIFYSSNSIPLSVCIDKFDEYFNREWNCHWHNEFEFLIVISGEVEYTIYNCGEHNVKQILKEGDGIFVSAGTIHSAKGIKLGSVAASIVFPVSFLEIKPFENIYRQILRPVIETGAACILFNNSNEFDKPLLSALNELCCITKQESCYELHCIETVCKIWRLLTIKIMQDKNMAKSAASNSVQEQRLRKMLSFIHSNYDKNIGIDDISRSAAISRTECFRCFGRILSKSPSEYLTEYRISMSATMLSDSEKSLSEISIACGFNSTSYFGKLFKLQYGVSPKKYREKVFSYEKQ